MSHDKFPGPGSSSEQQESKEREPFRVMAGGYAMPSPAHKEFCEDKFFADEQKGIIAVFDGLGSAAGELASEASVKTLEHASKDSSAFPSLAAETTEPVVMENIEREMRLLITAMSTAMAKELDTREGNALIDKKIAYFAARKYNPDPTGKLDLSDERVVRDFVRRCTASTASIVKAWRNKDGQEFITIAQLGDSKIHLYRNKQLLQLSQEDSLKGIAERYALIERGRSIDKCKLEQILGEDIFPQEDRRELETILNLFPPKDVILSVQDLSQNMTRCLGPHIRGSAIPQILTIPMQAGDILVASTDGMEKKIRGMTGGKTIEDGWRKLLADMDGAIRASPSDAAVYACEEADFAIGHNDDVATAFLVLDEKKV